MEFRPDSLLVITEQPENEELDYHYRLIEGGSRVAIESPFHYVDTFAISMSKDTMKLVSLMNRRSFILNKSRWAEPPNP